MDSRPVLSLAEIDAFDPQGPVSRKWCPPCGDGRPKDAAHRCLSIERQNGLWKCFRCGQSGQAKEFWAEKPAFSARQAKNQVLRAAFQRQTHAIMPKTAPKTPEIASNAAEPQSDWGTRWNAAQSLRDSPGAEYLARRGVSPEVAQLAEVKWSANWSGQRAVVFPIRTRNGEIIAAQARAIRGESKLTAGPKKEGAFFAPVRLENGRVCSPFDQAIPAIILVEAPIDALSLAVCGFPALALCGTSGPSWLHLACGLCSVALGFDADEAGDRAGVETRRILQPFGARCARLRPPNFKDWNEELLQSGAPYLKDWLVVALMLS